VSGVACGVALNHSGLGSCLGDGMPAPTLAALRAGAEGSLRCNLNPLLPQLQLLAVTVGHRCKRHLINKSLPLTLPTGCTPCTAQMERWASVQGSSFPGVAFLCLSVDEGRGAARHCAHTFRRTLVSKGYGPRMLGEGCDEVGAVEHRQCAPAARPK